MILLLAFLASAPGPAAPLPPQAATSQETPLITVDGQPFFTWQDYVRSDVFALKNLRCATPAAAGGVVGAPPSDCSYTRTTIKAENDPTFVYQIPVVVHVIRDSGGSQGNITQAKVRSQIDILNEDFRALAGTPGGPGTDALVEFFLATTDPSGNPTNGITYSNNTTWFNDGGGYWNSLAWDTDRYLNIYTNLASGALGYVPDLPQGGIVGSNSDRVVVLWSSFGRNGPIGPPYNQGRTATHEVGHYLGLFHTFDGGCGSVSACDTTGDLICDTNRQDSPTFGCPGSSSSCGSQDPFHNYMDYTDDLCMYEFTPDQTNRIRCTLRHWRPDLAFFGTPASTQFVFGSGCNFPGFVEQTPPVVGTTWQTIVSFPPGASASFLALSGVGPTQVKFSAGELLILPPFLAPPVAGAGDHNVTIPFDITLLGITIYAQAATVAPLTLHNALYATVGT